MALTVGVDIGGTHVAAGVVDDSGLVLARAGRPTPSGSPGQVLAVIAEVVAEVVAELRAAHDVAAVGIGAAGSAADLAPDVAGRLGLPVVVENDDGAAAWAECRFGAGRAEPDVVVVTVGTRIGGGVVLGGQLQRGPSGVGAQFGHLQLVRDGRRCGCGQRGCWEQYCSGRALEREAREIADVRPAVGARLLELGGGRPEGIEAPAVTQAAREGDPAALECFDVIGGWLGQGLADLAAVLDPGVFVVGGGVAEAGELLVEPARRAYVERLTGSAYRPHAAVRAALLGHDATLLGAADLARTA